jgi:hypothetical protein
MNAEQDIVERLRNHVNHRNGPSLLNGAWQMMLDAADEIAKLRAERDAAAREMQERCAKVAEHHADLWRPSLSWLPRVIALAIRLLPDVLSVVATDRVTGKGE